MNRVLTAFLVLASGCTTSHVVYYDCDPGDPPEADAPCEFDTSCRIYGEDYCATARCEDGLVVLDESCNMPHASCDTAYEMQPGDACSFTGRCATLYSDFYGGRCGDEGWECVRGAIESYDATFACEPPPRPGALGDPCALNTDCFEGYCYGDVASDGSFGPGTCMSACLDDDDRAHYCDEDSDCCTGSCALDAGEREGLCLPG